MKSKLLVGTSLLAVWISACSDPSNSDALEADAGLSDAGSPDTSSGDVTRGSTDASSQSGSTGAKTTTGSQTETATDAGPTGDDAVTSTDVGTDSGTNSVNDSSLAETDAATSETNSQTTTTDSSTTSDETSNDSTGPNSSEQSNTTVDPTSSDVPGTRTTDESSSLPNDSTTDTTGSTTSASDDSSTTETTGSTTSTSDDSSTTETTGSTTSASDDSSTFELDASLSDDGDADAGNSDDGGADESNADTSETETVDTTDADASDSDANTIGTDGPDANTDDVDTSDDIDASLSNDADADTIGTDDVETDATDAADSTDVTATSDVTATEEATSTDLSTVIVVIEAGAKDAAADSGDILDGALDSGILDDAIDSSATSQNTDSDADDSDSGSSNTTSDVRSETSGDTSTSDDTSTELNLDPRSLFEDEQFGGNGRTCLTCHGPISGSISPAEIQALFASNPNDPMFRPIDSNDGVGNDYSILLERATFRVEIALPPGVTLVSDPSATSIVLRRSALSTINTPGLDPTLMWDGRAVDLADQAFGAITGHAEATVLPTQEQLEAIIEFEKTDAFFSSDTLRNYFGGGAAPQWPPGNTASEQRGRRWFAQDPNANRFNICGQCHGGPMTNETQQNSGLPVGEHFQTANVSEFNTKGNPVYEFQFPDPENPGQTVTVSTPDPGLALTTGDVRDVNFFKIPSLWGISRTAPYFHDNSAATLEELMDHYEDHLATFLFRGFNFPFPHVPTAQDKADIIAYMRLL